MIKPEIIALVKERTDIVAVVGESVTLKKRGRSFLGLCPFHKEKTPSFHVNPDRGFFHCFGCKESGGAIDFVMKHDGLTFPEAVRLLADRCGVVVEEDERPRPEVDRARREREDLYAVLAAAATFYEEQLRTHSSRRYALEELDRRGLIPGRDAQVDHVLQEFRVGYAPPGWDALAKWLEQQRFSPVLAEQVGLIVPRTGAQRGHYDRFRHRLMFAVTDVQGRVVAFSGRALPEESPEDGRDPPPKYVNSPESPVFKKGAQLFGLFQARHAIRREEVAVLVEGNFDVVSLHARGVDNVCAPLGTAFTAEQAKLLRRFAPRAILFFDADDAGKKATRAARDACREAGLTALVSRPPEGKDPDELVRARGADGLRDVLKQARGLLEHLIDEALDESFVAADLRERADRVARVAKLLSEEDDPIVRSMAKAYADQLAGRLDLVRSPEAFRALEASVRRAVAQHERESRLPDPRAARSSYASPEQPSGRAQRAAIVGALIEWPELLDDPEIEPALALLMGDSARAVAALAQCLRAPEGGAGEGEKNAASGQKTLDTAGFLAQMPPAIQVFASRHLAAPEHEKAEEAKQVVLMNANKLQDVLSRDASEALREMKSAEDREKLEHLRELKERALARLKK